MIEYSKATSYRINLPEEGLYYSYRGTKDPVGPVSYVQLKEKFLTRDIPPNSFIWYHGLQSWVSLKDCDGFNTLAPAEKLAPPNEIKADQLLVITDGNEVPFTLAKAIAAVEAKEILHSDAVYSSNTKKWTRADEHEDLKSTFEKLNAIVFEPQVEPVDQTEMVNDEAKGDTPEEDPTQLTAKPEMEADLFGEVTPAEAVSKEQNIEEEIEEEMEEEPTPAPPVLAKKEVNLEEDLFAPITPVEEVVTVKPPAPVEPRKTTLPETEEEVEETAAPALLQKAPSVDKKTAPVKGSLFRTLTLWLTTILFLLIAALSSSILLFKVEFLSFIDRSPVIQSFLLLFK